MNSRFILAGKMCVRGSAGLEKICGVMGLPPPVGPKSYSAHNNILQQCVQKMCEWRALRLLLHSFIDCRVPIQAILLMLQLHVTVPGLIVDFFPPYGVVAVILWETGQVLDVTVLSKSCKVCKETESAMGRESQEFLDWMD